MVNYSSIYNEFVELVGFRTSSEIPLSTSLETSESGLYVTNLTPVSTELIHNIISKDTESLSSGTLKVGNYYQIIDNSGAADFTGVGAADNNVDTIFEATDTSPTWGTGSVNTMPVVDYLNKIRKDEIYSIMRTFFVQMQKKLGSTELKSNQVLLNYVGTQPIEQNGTAHGYYIQVKNSNSLAFAIKSISLQLDSVDSVCLYLYELGKKSAIYTFIYSAIADQVSFDSVDEWFLNYRDEDNVGKEYLLLYYDYDSENEQPTNQLDATSKVIVSTSNMFNLSSEIAKYVYIQPVEIPKKHWNWTGTTYAIPDLENKKPLNYCTTVENGLNFTFNITCDVTLPIIQNKLLFSRILQLAFAIRILRDAIASTRINQIERITHDNAIQSYDRYVADLFGDTVVDKGGKIQSIKGEIDHLIKNFKNIDIECFNNFNNFNSISLTNNSFVGI